MIEIIDKSAEETKRIAADLAGEIKKQPSSKFAFIIALEGNLGSGKTTFIQGLATGLGIKEKVLSPTFLILKQFPVDFSAGGGSALSWKNFYHIDAYRIEHQSELLSLGFEDLIEDPENIIAIEWADKIKKILPKNILWIKFENLGKNKRRIIMKE